MALESEGPFAEFARETTAGLRSRRLVIFEDFFAIDHDRNTFVLNDDLLRPPFLVLGRRLSDVHQAVKAARLNPI